MLRWDGVIETVTRLPGNEFFYGPVVPDEPQYITSAITTGQLWPYVSYFAGNSGDNGEGTMNIPFNSLAPTKSGNRITTKPGYYDYGMLELYASIGEPPTSTSTAEPPLLFVTSPSMLNAGAVNTQHSDIKGISVGTVGGVPLLPTAGVQFQQLQGFQNFSGHPFGFWFESQSSVWLADAGLGVFDKTSCEIQRWTSTKDILTGIWSKSGASILVDATTPCYGLAGRMEGGVATLYTSTSTASSSKIYKIAGGIVSTVLTAGPNQVYRAVAIPPQPRGNYTCPPNQFGVTADLACSYDCCASCRTSCPSGLTLVPTCSLASDNLCVAASALLQAPLISQSSGAASAGVQNLRPPTCMLSNNDVQGSFSLNGTVLGLRVGGSATGGAGAPVMVSGVAQPLFIDEINVATGAIVQTRVIPPTGTTLGKNLACTLSTGMFASNNWK